MLFELNNQALHFLDTYAEVRREEDYDWFASIPFAIFDFTVPSVGGHKSYNNFSPFYPSDGFLFR